MADPDLATPEPDSEIGSLNHLDFGRPKISWAVRKAVSMLPRGKRRLFLLATGVQVSLGLLDLLGIALIGIVAAVAVSGISPDSLPMWVQSLLDGLGLGGLTVSQLSVAVALTAVIVLVAKTVLSAFMARVITNFLAHRQADLSVTLARAFLRRPLTTVQRWTTSEATYALGQGANAATVALLGSAVAIASEAFLFTIIGVSLLLYDPILTLAAGAFFVTVLLVLHNVLGRLTARNASVVKDTSISTLTVVSEALSTYRETTVLDRRDLYISRYESVVSRYARAAAANSFIVEIPKYVLEAALYLGVLVLGIVQFLTKDWSAAATTTALFLAAGSRIVPSMLRLQGAGIGIRNASVMAQPTFYMFDQLEQPSERGTDEGAAALARRVHEHIASGYPGFVADVEVRGVTLTFPGAPEPVLDDVALAVEPGHSIALVGVTGAGKSTLADVILGVLAPDRGTVLLGGLPPRDAIARWAGAIAYVPQSVALVAGTVRENVALGLPAEAIDDDLVWEALNRAHLGDFLAGERDGLDTYIGERGFKLSGGQRQRLGIARALYTRPRLLVLDEATSALDAETELAIIETLAELEGFVTTITVAHRLATVRGADQILYLDHGSIVASGTFDEVRTQSTEFDRQASLLGL